jgi:hypothetical protein
MRAGDAELLGSFQRLQRTWRSTTILLDTSSRRIEAAGHDGGEARRRWRSASTDLREKRGGASEGRGGE